MGKEAEGEGEDQPVAVEAPWEKEVKKPAAKV